MAALLLGSLTLIVVATTMPWSWYYVGHPHWTSVEWVPFTRRVRIGDFMLNVLLFVPLGGSALRVFAHEREPDAPRTWQPRAAVVAVVVAGCLLSVSVELFQVYCHGRIATTADVLSNTLGTWFGTRVGRR